MAYSEKYYKEITRKGRTYRLSIQQRDYTGTALEIGDLTSLHIEVQAGTEDIDTPIIKSYCTFGIVDAWDVNKAGQKWGRWEEFYTNDSTLYRVQLLQGDSLRWTGYITPYSWEEDLCYRGTVNVTARDNFGHLADFNFNDEWTDAYISISQIIEKCGNLIGQEISIDETVGLYYNGWSGDHRFGYLSTRFSSEVFKDKSWYSVLENSFKALGLVLRYIDDGTYIVTTMERQHNAMGDYTLRNTKQAVFTGQSGHRTLVAPYKEIVEKIEYSYTDKTEAKDMSVHSLARPSFATMGRYTGTGYNIMKEDGNIALPVASLDYSKYLYLAMTPARKTKFSVSFKGAGTYFGLNNGVLYPTVSMRSYAMKYKYALVWISGGVTNYYQGENSSGASVWNTTQKVYTFTAEASADTSSVTYTEGGTTFTTPDSEGSLELRVYAAEGGSGWGLINDVVYGPAAGNYKSHTTRTKYDLNANTVNERTCELGQFMGDPNQALIVTNALLSDTNKGATGWGKESDSVPRYNSIWEMLHKWLLCYYSKPNNVLTGDFIDLTSNDPKFSDIWSYGGTKHILTSGRLNILNGMMEGATLREYVAYDDLWSDSPVDAIKVECYVDEMETFREDGVLVIPMRPMETDYLHIRIKTATGWMKPRVDVRVVDCWGEANTITFPAGTVKADGQVLDMDLEADFLVEPGMDDAVITITAAIQDDGWTEIDVLGDNKIYVRANED